MDTFGARSSLVVGDRSYEIYRLGALAHLGHDLDRLPYALKVWLENLLRNEDGQTVTASHIRCLAEWKPDTQPGVEIPFVPARVLLQDFTGVPSVVDLAAMRDAMSRLGGDPARINPLRPVELVIDHSVQVDAYGSETAQLVNTGLEFERNRERFSFLRWGQLGFHNLKVVPPGAGIVHQVNLEYLARVVFTTPDEGSTGEEAPLQAYPDTLVGADSHTTMVNALGVLGWGVGGIEAEAAMLGQPLAMLIPQVVGLRLMGEAREGVTATDVVLMITQMLRSRGVVGKLVEFCGPGLSSLPVTDRATIANMAPEYGATCGFFPVDRETLLYLRMTGRSEQHLALVEAYCREQGLFHTAETPEADYSDVLELDLGTVEPAVAGPSRPQDRVALADIPRSFASSLRSILEPKGSTAAASPGVQGWEAEGGSAGRATANDLSNGAEASTAEMPTAVKMKLDGRDHFLDHGSIVIAAITSCTNTSNTSAMLAAGLLARKAVEAGLRTPPWVKSSLAPGSKVVTDILKAAGLLTYLEALRFDVVGYGCTTCIGNSGPLPDEVSKALEEGNLVTVSVLSGNRNFSGRVHPEVKANYLMSPPLVVAYALAGNVDRNLASEPVGTGANGKPVYLSDIWPTRREIEEAMGSSINSEMYRRSYAALFDGDENWNALDVGSGDRVAWDPFSTYIRRPPYFDNTNREAPERVAQITGARVLALLGDSVTTDHISPAGNISKDSPAGRYLLEQGVGVRDFNSYGARRGNHEVMVRGTFGSVRLRNRLSPGKEGGYTTYLPMGDVTSIYDAAMQYKADGVPLIVVAGKDYGFGSSRDWAAKGPALLGVQAVIAESYERIHRFNLVGMGIVPLQFLPGESAQALGLTGREVYDFIDLAEAVASGFADGKLLKVRVIGEAGEVRAFKVQVRIDTTQELLYYRHGGILPYVLRQLLERGQEQTEEEVSETRPPAGKRAVVRLSLGKIARRNTDELPRLPSVLIRLNQPTIQENLTGL